MITKFNIYINESLRDKIKGKSEDEIESAKYQVIERIADKAIDLYPERFNDFLNTIEYFEPYEDSIIEDIKDGISSDEIIRGIIDGKW